MHRWAALLALVGCEPPAPAPEPPPPRWVYAPPPPSWPLGELRGHLGRSQAPQLAPFAGIVGEPVAPLRLATLFAVPGDGPARALAYGLVGAEQAIELIDVDAGRVVWRDDKACDGPVVGVTEASIVCTGPHGVAGIGLDGKPRWRRDESFLAMTGDQVAVAGAGEVIVLDADGGDELARLTLPKAIAVESIAATCGDAGRELFARGRDGALVRIADVKGAPAVTWSVPITGLVELDACEGPSIVASVGVGDARSLVAITRATGKLTGRVDGVRGSWPAREGGDRIEIATSAGVAIHPRDLASAPVATELPPLRELIATRGDRRLVRASEGTAVVIDRAGVRAHVLFGSPGGVLGDSALVGSTWTGSPGETIHRLALPARWRRPVLRLPRRVGVAVPAELRDLPEPAILDPAAAIGKPDTAMHEVHAFAVDGATLYAVTLEHAADDERGAGLASVDLARRSWRWQRSEGCGPGTPVGLAAAAEVVVCGARTRNPRAATVRATSRDGAGLWEWEGDNADAVQAAGSTVIVHDAGRLYVLDAATGRLRGRIASDDGTPVRAALVAIDSATYLVTYERGRLVARLPSSGILPAWSLAVDGVVRSIAASADGVLVELEDGDAYRVELRSAAVTALPGLGLAWRASADLVTGHTAGGPIPGIPARVVAPAGRFVLPPRDAYGRPIVPDPDRPRMSTPIPPPPPLGDSWQYTLYELSGALRSRNDYALSPPIAPAAVRGPAGSPLVVASGAGLREVLVLDPRTGDPVKRVHLPETAAPGLVFGTVVDGTPVAGALLAAPLRVVLF